MTLLEKILVGIRDAVIDHFDEAALAVCHPCWEKYGRPPALLYRGQKPEYSCRYCGEPTKEPVFLDRLRMA